mmetsp:Transcript_7175/g.8084  ORF Transcript_7175/g.8084 Transcript_7175/m.8084 type:complete len:366 (+) Transcript_7175:45-1142(+)|eukprot:CAMPEP_0205830892 /NCGR_PEP_ID=MMETSP0206-20130828/42428_1 /ASSEMBLY_ACC=CAM_ASM_000279 /TAXON_ID=36767 /ORGANISM="Euplotes focardii, Strain TN1" /LENGTH=365 /DNA_ID=CAMNT_0053134975 /DNA_START=45 /DNA_END=1142 /DNA_ORIENTATION=-
MEASKQSSDKNSASKDSLPSTDATTSLPMVKNTSISQFLNQSQGQITTPTYNQTFHRLSLVSPMYEQPKPVLPSISFSNPLENKSPSIAQSESSKKATPLPLPADTPAGTLRKTPTDGMSSQMGATPMGMTPLQTNKGFEAPGKPASQAYSSYEKQLNESGMNIQELNQSNTIIAAGVRRPQEEPTLQNIVSTVDLKCKLDLKTIALNARNTEYNPKRFAAAIMKIRNPKTTALIFSSGKMVCTGAKSEEDSKKAAKKYAKTIKNMGFDVKFTDFKVQNIVASADVGFAIRLESLSHKHVDFCQYEPEIFPGLIYRIYKPKVVVLIFVSGKIVLTGAKTREQIKEAYHNILPALQMHKKEDTNML